MTNADQVRTYLQSYGDKYIACDSLEDMIVASKIKRNQFVAGFYQLARSGEITQDVIKSPGGRKFVKGVTLNHMPSTETIIRKDAEKKKISAKAPIQNKSNLVHVTEYLKKKSVIEEIKEKLAANGFIPEEMLTFNEDPMGEEAVALLDLVGRAQTALSAITEERDQLAIDLEAEKEINKRYAEKLKFNA
jgi:hypothetical protein